MQTVARERDAGARTVRGGSVGRRIAVVVAGAAVLVAASALSTAVGSRNIPSDVVLGALTGSGSDLSAATVVLDSRLPRTVIGLLAGVALGVSGALMQGVTRNPLADPGILGVTAGAAFAVAVAVAVLRISDASGYVWFAFGGALAGAVVVYLVGASGRGGASPARLTLAGLALGAVLSGVVSAMLLADPDGFTAMRAWESGSLEGRGWDGVAAVWPFLLVGLALAAVVSVSLNAVVLGDDLAAALGAHVGRTRVLAVIAVALLAGGATAVAGPIAFVGLMIPHVARRLVGPDQRWIVAVSVVAGPILLLGADVVGRVVLRPGELPAGIVTACIGAPVLIALARRQRALGL